MRTIMLMNAKGGCGKTTLATNLATWYADEGKKVALADFDPQGSSLDWLVARNDYEGIPQIEGIDGTQGPVRPARNTDYLIMDVPSRVHGKEVNDMLRRVERLIVPVLPSPLDMRAVVRFIGELVANGRVSRHQTEIALVANRARENTIIYHKLEDFLKQFSIPFIGSLRESQNYIRAAERGLGVFELAPSMVWQDVASWDPVFDWLTAGN